MQCNPADLNLYKSLKELLSNHYVSLPENENLPPQLMNLADHHLAFQSCDLEFFLIICQTSSCGLHGSEVFHVRVKTPTILFITSKSANSSDLFAEKTRLI